MGASGPRGSPNWYAHLLFKAYKRFKNIAISNQPLHAKRIPYLRDVDLLAGYVLAAISGLSLSWTQQQATGQQA